MTSEAMREIWGMRTMKSLAALQDRRGAGFTRFDGTGRRDRRLIAAETRAVAPQPDQLRSTA